MRDVLFSREVDVTRRRLNEGNRRTLLRDEVEDDEPDRREHRRPRTERDDPQIEAVLLVARRCQRTDLVAKNVDRAGPKQQRTGVEDHVILRATVTTHYVLTSHPHFGCSLRIGHTSSCCDVTGI